MIGMVMREEHPSTSILSARAVAGANRSTLSTSSRAPALSITIEERVRRLLGSSGSQSPQSLPMRGTPVMCRNRASGASCGGFSEQREEIGRGGRCGERLERFSAQLGEEAAVSRTKAGSQACRDAARARGRAVRFDQQAICGNFCSQPPASPWAFLKVTIPEIEIVSPSSSAVRTEAARVR